MRFMVARFTSPLVRYFKFKKRWLLSRTALSNSTLVLLLEPPSLQKVLTDRGQALLTVTAFLLLPNSPYRSFVGNSYDWQ